MAERAAVLERHPQVRVGDPVTQPAARELELGDDELVEQPDDVGAGADDKALVGEGTLERGRASEPLAPLEHEHRLAGPGEIGRCGETVVATPDDDRIPVASGQLGDRFRQPDLAELLGDAIHTATSESIRSDSM